MPRAHRSMLVIGVSVLLGLWTPPIASAAAACSPGPGVQRTYTYTEIGVFGTASSDGRGSSAAWAVNNATQVVGASTTNVFGATRAYLWQSGQLINLGVVGGGTYAASVAYGINDAGDVVGQTHVNSTSPPHAFLYRAGVMTDLGTGYRSGGFSRGWDINSVGRIVGERARQQSSPVRAFLWQSGRFQDLGTLGGTSSDASGINVHGQVVGGSRTPTSPPYNAGRAFLWEAGQLMDLNIMVTNLPGNVILEIGRAISDNGVIVGHTCSGFCEPGKDAPTRGFVLVPN